MGDPRELPEVGESSAARELTEIVAGNLARRWTNVAPANCAGTPFAAPPRRGPWCSSLADCNRRRPAPSVGEGPAASEECGEGEKRRSSAPMVDDISGTRMLLG